MSIVSVDNIQPIGSGTSVTVNKSVTLESGNTNITGVCTATSFVGSGANLTSLPAQATIANNADNRVITGGSGVNLNGEANLTFNGSSSPASLGLTGDLSVVGGWPKINLQATQANGENYQIAGAVQGVNNAGFCIRNTTDSVNILEVDTDSSRNLKVVSGNLVIGTAGKGIDFSAQTASSATGTTVTSELLDHYEEGNWLPDIRGSSTAGTATYTSRNGRYVRIGRIVHVYTDVRWSAHTGSGGLEVHGLPFPQTGGYWGHFGFNYNSGHSWTSGRQIYGWANIGGDFIRYWQTDSNGGSGNLPLDSVVPEIHFYGHYLTST